MISSSLENSALFATYGFLKRLQGLDPNDTHLKIHNEVISAVGASFVTSTILTPFELLKCRMQVYIYIINNNRCYNQQKIEE